MPSQIPQKELALRERIQARASTYPGVRKLPYIRNIKKELRRICDFIVGQQQKDGTWLDSSKNFRFYSDAYAIRTLMAANDLTGERRYRDAALKWLKYITKIQRGDGGWWVGYSWGDHDFDDPTHDQTVVYLADAGEVVVALVNAYHFLSKDSKAQDTADSVRQALVRFRDFADQFRLRSGAIGLGYTQRDFYRSESENLVRRPFMQAHYRPYPFATAVTGINFYAGLFTITRNREDWDKAAQSLDWCLEHSFVETSSEFSHSLGAALDFKHLHRCLDVAFYCSDASMQKTRTKDPTPEPMFKDRERQKLYSLWKYCMHLIAESQSANGEWPVRRGDDEVAIYEGALRHRLFFLYSLTSYLKAPVFRKKEDQAVEEAWARQLWLCSDPEILKEHYGVCVPGAHMMPTGLWGMTLCELIQPGITLPMGES